MFVKFVRDNLDDYLNSFEGFYPSLGTLTKDEIENEMIVFRTGKRAVTDNLIQLLEVCELTKER
jgi:hypothetical protein